MVCIDRRSHVTMESLWNRVVMTKRLLIVTFLSLALVAAIALNISPYLRGPDSWRWAYAIPGTPWRHWVPAAVIALYVGGVAIGWSHLGRLGIDKGGWRRRAFVLAIAIATPIVQLALHYPESPDVLRPLFYRTISPGASGVFTVGSRIDDLGDFLRAYPSLMPTFPVHPQRYPPGLPILFYVARQILARTPNLAEQIGMALRPYQCHNLALMELSNVTLASAALQMALPVLTGLTVFPLYRLARETVNNEAALLAVGFYPLVPSFALWSARWDQAYPLMTCIIWASFAVGLKRNQWPWILIAGLCLGAATFLSFGLVVLLMPLGLWAVLWTLCQPDGWQVLWSRMRGTHLRLALTFITGLILPWLAYQVAFGTGFLAIWRVSMSYHLGLARNYWVWLGYHLYDFLLFLGIPLAVLFVHAVATGRKRMPGTAFIVAVGASLLLLNFSGVAQGEVARVWLFLTPLPVIAAAADLAHGREQAENHIAPAIAVLALLAVQLVVFNAFLRVVTTGVTEPPIRSHHYETHSNTIPVSAVLDEQLALLGYQLQPAPVRDTLAVTLTWQALGPIPHSYTVFTHLLSPEGKLVAQDDGLPQEGKAPTTCWMPGEILMDAHSLQIPTDAEPGTYTLNAGLYRYENDSRLPLRGASVIQDDAVLLGTVIVAGHD